MTICENLSPTKTKASQALQAVESILSREDLIQYRKDMELNIQCQDAVFLAWRGLKQQCEHDEMKRFARIRECCSMQEPSRCAQRGLFKLPKREARVEKTHEKNLSLNLSSKEAIEKLQEKHDEKQAMEEKKKERRDNATLKRIMKANAQSTKENCKVKASKIPHKKAKKSHHETRRRSKK